MRKVLVIAIGLLTLVIQPPDLAAADIAGKYAGDWSSSANGASGEFRLSLAAAGAGKWNLEVTFTLAGAEVKTVTHSIKVEGTSIEAAYDFDLGGNRLRSAIQGKLAEGKLAGVYKTTTVAEGVAVDEGAWKAAPAK